jgi:hypothetical protein
VATGSVHPATVQVIADGVTGVSFGDRTLGNADWAGGPTAGASDHAIMNAAHPVIPTGELPVRVVTCSFVHAGLG